MHKIIYIAATTVFAGSMSLLSVANEFDTEGVRIDNQTAIQSSHLGVEEEKEPATAHLGLSNIYFQLHQREELKRLEQKAIDEEAANARNAIVRRELRESLGDDQDVNEGVLKRLKENNPIAGIDSVTIHVIYPSGLTTIIHGNGDVDTQVPFIPESPIKSRKKFSETKAAEVTEAVATEVDG